MKSTIFTLCLLCFTAHLCAAEETSPFFAAAQTTYGSYNGSAERKSLLTEAGTLGYATDTFGATVIVRNWKLYRISMLGDLSGIDTNVSLYAWRKVGTAGSVGATAAVNYLTGNDSNTDQKVVPYGAITYKTPDGGQYFDVGYAYMGYSDTTVNQVTSTWGVALFDRYVWAQTRLYYHNLSTEVQGKGQTTAVEERLTWYVVPSTLSLTLSGMVGQRIYGYDPDLKITYTLSDIQKGSVGLTGTWQMTPALTLFGDVTYATYEKRSINNSYNAVFGTVGLSFNF